MSISYREQLIQIKQKYRNAGEEWPATNRMVAAWAVKKRLFDVQESDAIDICAKELSEAFGTDVRRNAQGKVVRTMAAAPRLQVDEDGKAKQLWFWDDVDTASHEHMLASFRARRNATRADIRKLQDDVEDYNENRLKNGHLAVAMSFNFDEFDADETAQDAVA